jgi:hypothetical protein
VAADHGRFPGDDPPQPGDAIGFSKMMEPIMNAAMRRANRKDLRNLKSILESR